MQTLYYSVIGVLAIIIHLIINYEMFSKPKEKDNTTIKFFHLYLVSVLFYYITDTFWGILDYFGKTSFLYVDTVFYYIFMGFSVVFCCRYIIEFLNLNKVLGKFLKAFGMHFCVFEFILLVVNFFKPIFFYFDGNGLYHASIFRYVILILQIVMFVVITLISFFVALHRKKDVNNRNITICLFGITMTVTIIMQTFFPLLPLYSIGLLIGNCILHIFIQEDIKNEQFEVLESLSEIFYSLHVIDLVNDTVEEFNAVNEVKTIANHRHGASEMMRQIMIAVNTDEYLEEALRFTDLSTISERMKYKKIISGEFVGNRVGWYLASFITMEVNGDGKPTKVIFSSRVIDEEKKQKEKLILKTQTDQMTGVLNRRAYEEDIYIHNNLPEEDNFIYVSIDVNGLKIINDEKGHLAGDELIIGACKCMKKTLGKYGKLYRIGGDEFVAIIFCTPQEMQQVFGYFENSISSWSGKLIDSISVSYGWVSKYEFPEASTRQLGSIAEKRMYEAKSAHYRKQGVDRRGQQDAHKALCELYTKILKINLTEDSYNIVNMDLNEQTEEKGFSDKISEWLMEFGKSGQVHPEDLDEYLRLTNLDYLRNYFKAENNSLSIFYRRKYGETFKPVIMEIIRTTDYNSENQTLFLYVKSINK